MASRVRAWSTGLVASMVVGPEAFPTGIPSAVAGDREGFGQPRRVDRERHRQGQFEVLGIDAELYPRRS